MKKVGVPIAFKWHREGFKHWINFNILHKSRFSNSHISQSDNLLQGVVLGHVARPDQSWRPMNVATVIVRSLVLCSLYACVHTCLRVCADIN